MILRLFILVSTVKLLFLPLYRSTDFEVHRNWLAITHNLTTDKWYYENTSEWTLDYPPFFAWLEYGLSRVAKWFDPNMLIISNLDYTSEKTILFQRLSVIVLDIVYFVGVKSCTSLVYNGKLLAFILLIANPGLLMVDHIHFQYNGFLYGILMISVSHMIQSNYLQAAFWFAVLLNLKHIYLYIAPVYIIYLLRAYCFTVPSKDGKHTAWYSFSFANIVKLGLTVIFVFALSFGPFISHLPQIISRLFPFKRGLCHAYWAPNFWALYNAADIVLQKILPKFGVAVVKSQGSMTAGLVQEFEHAVLPTIKPYMSTILTVVSMLPALVKMWSLCADRSYRAVNFVRCLVVCAACSFMFSWHVHEKAILMILIPLSKGDLREALGPALYLFDGEKRIQCAHSIRTNSVETFRNDLINTHLNFLAVMGDVDGRLFLVLSTAGHYSLFPLLFPKNMLGIKLFLLLTHVAFSFYNIPTLYMKNKNKRFVRRFLSLPMLCCTESLYIYGLIPLFLYENMLHALLKLDKTLPFLPLMMTSVYCAVGVTYFWISYYHYFLTFNLSIPKTIVTNTEPAKKLA